MLSGDEHTGAVTAHKLETLDDQVLPGRDNSDAVDIGRGIPIEPTVENRALAWIGQELDGGVGGPGLTEPQVRHGVGPFSEHHRGSRGDLRGGTSHRHDGGEGACVAITRLDRAVVERLVLTSMAGADVDPPRGFGGVHGCKRVRQLWNPLWNGHVRSHVRSHVRWGSIFCGSTASKHSQQAPKKREFPYNNHLVTPVS